MIKPQLDNYPFLWDNKTMMAISRLQQGGKDHCIPLIYKMLMNLGLDAIQKYVFELKF